MPVTADEIRLVETCMACPEQYDAFLGDVPVAYLRLRWGIFRVHVPDAGGAVILQEFVGDELELTGQFSSEERPASLRRARESIARHLNEAR